ncbi:helicase [Rhodothalassium salexigens]|uniref:ATP-dependent DNA helicase n=1 Tax=Rhodothalassium salexigens TaxID=1086 RepID=UPI0019119984|nr:ATP-dependent DNA helicase [Rhodothalassium salexigens]MBK5912482.1 helicase [Rhodothalassium salexigens]
MAETIAQFAAPGGLIDRTPVLVAGAGRAVVLSGDGRVERLDADAAAARLAEAVHLLCNAPAVGRRLGLSPGQALDVLELFAFVRPARFCLPTPVGLARTLSLDDPGADLDAQAHAVRAAARALMAELAEPGYGCRAGAADVAMMMARGGWPWGAPVLGALGETGGGRAGLAVWSVLPEWEEGAPPPRPGDDPVAGAEALDRLAALLGDGAEPRETQRDYARTAATVFTPRRSEQAPNLALAEAGTGTGKTLGYIAPASLWAERNEGTVWLSTYTKNLQRQLDQELDRLYPDRRDKAAHAVIRKGRENYLCLLNLEETANAVLARGNEPVAARDKVLVGLVMRWARFTRDGDMIGGDFPSWLGAHFGPGRIAGLTDRRGECLYAACSHYRKCFIERVTRRARRARLVVGNHALVMAQAVRRAGDPDAPRRLVFDEGHHLFDAADSAFSGHLSGLEGADLRRWVRGREGRSTSRTRGLSARIAELVGADAEAGPLLTEVIAAAGVLPGEGWLTRVANAQPQGPYERFLTHARAQVMARAPEARSGFSLEATLNTPIEGLVDAAADLSVALDDLAKPLAALANRLIRLLDEEAETLDTPARGRLDAAARSLQQRRETVVAWQQMLEAVGGTTPAAFVDWVAVERAGGRERDVGLHRHWVDPSQPFAEAVLEPAHGVLITSATLRDGAAEDDDWRSAEVRTGAAHMVLPGERLSVASPFDYGEQARVFVVTDVNKRSLAQVAGAYRALIEAAGGGALGLFTAIQRLRAVYDQIAAGLEDTGLPLYAQHVDPMDPGTLVDIFRAEARASLFGTDALRDGVDVPGASLKLLIFDRVPWPRPTILHQARKAAFGRRTYDDLLVRLRLRQAFGRLIRARTDRGVFVLLDNQAPSRLMAGLPHGAEVNRVGLAEAVAGVRDFLAR